SHNSSLISKYAKVWWRVAVASLLSQLSTPLASVGYLLGKLVRLFFFCVFIVAIFGHTQSLKGYSLIETVLFFLTFNLIDMIAQLFFRGIYGARRIVMDGDLDYFLIQPVNPLFRMTTGTVDFLDLFTLLPVLGMTGYTLFHLPEYLSLAHLGLYAFLLFNGILIALAIHIAVAAIAVRTQELENTIWIYRDLMAFGRFPVDIYSPGVRWVLTLVIPIAVMTSFPTQAFLGRLSVEKMLFSSGLTIAMIGISLWLWRQSLKRYMSVSS
ncbi:MAG: ABC-2 family transporter protein, partial [Elusimicrobia bacterium]|nr:ABC-2 family transporter protein [Elusimicrobiota bacterium]